ncbi:MAG: hypothetical protein AB8G26_13155 [Ilumatobacter sp.]
MRADPPSGTVLCLADARDHSLGWLRASVADLVVVTVDEIGRSAGFTLHQQRPNGDGRPGPSVAGLGLHGAELDLDAMVSVYCRVPVVGVDHLGFEAVDASYAAAEWNALLIGWLQVLGDRVVNRPLPHGLAGRWASLDSWAVLAHDAGLDAVTSRHDAVAVQRRERDDVIVVGSRVFSPHRLSDDRVDGFRSLARAIGSDIVGFSATDGWTSGPLLDLAGNPCPMLTDLDAAGRHAVATVLAAPGAGRRNDRRVA